MSVPEWAPAGDDETVRWQGQPRRRVVHLGVVIGIVLAIVVVAGTVTAMPGGVAAAVGVPLGLVAFVIPAGGAWLWRWSTRYVLTDAALYHRTGVLSLRVTELRLGKIQNTSYSQGVFGALFGHGTVTVDTAGSEGAELSLRQLDGPKTVHQQIAEAAGNAKGTDDEIPGSLAQWQAVRTEVKRLRSTLLGQRSDR